MPASSDPAKRARASVLEGGDGEIEDLKRRLAESEERLALVTEATSDGVYEWNIETNVLTVGPKLFAMFGINPHDITPGLWAARIHPEDGIGYRAAMISHLKGESERFRIVYRIRNDEGVERWVAENGVAVRGDDGRAVRMVGAINDITERKQAEERHPDHHGGRR